MHNDERMTPLERRSALSLASIYALRMLGLFMILPVFALYAQEMPGVTPTLIGLAIGAYGLSQALLQIPIAMVSDRIGRKPVIIAGLLVFAAGSVLAGMADSIWGVIAGRALQGAGAIAAVVMALAADLTREEHRVKAMAMIGSTIGLSFAVALVIGPVLAQYIGLSGIFWLTAVFAMGGIAVVKWIVPDPAVSRFRRDTEPMPSQFRLILQDSQLLRLNYGIFALHLVLTAMFVAMPVALEQYAGLPRDEHGWIYLWVMLLAMGGMVPLIIVAEKRRRLKQIFVGGVGGLALAQCVMIFGYSNGVGAIAGLFIFFISFNVLEALLPSLVAKTAPPDKKGTALGIYQTFQFLGAFFGGVSGGWLMERAGIAAVFAYCLIVIAVWAVLAFTMRNPRYLSSHMLNVGSIDESRARQLVAELTRVRGVAEAVVIAEEGVAYLRVDKHALDRDALRRFSVNPA